MFTFIYETLLDYFASSLLKNLLAVDFIFISSREVFSFIPNALSSIYKVSNPLNPLVVDFINFSWLTIDYFDYYYYDFSENPVLFLKSFWESLNCSVVLFY